MSAPLSIVVLREDIGPAPAAEYAECLADRFPDHDVHFARTPAMERSLIETADVVAGVHLDKSLLNLAQELELFACSWTGTDHLPLSACREAGVAVTNASGVHAPGLAAQAIGKILVFTRNLQTAFYQQQDRRWEHFRAGELDGSTVTIVGLGSIGSGIAGRLSGFDLHTIGIRHSPEKGGPTDEVAGYDEAAVHDALSRSDYVVLSCPLTDTTRGLIDRAAITTMPPRAVLVNVGRGPVVDTDALVWGLRENAIRGAALDVTDPEPLPESHPLWSFQNVIITPHIGGETPELWDRLTDLLERNIDQLASTGSTEGLENRVV